MSAYHRTVVDRQGRDDHGGERHRAARGADHAPRARQHQDAHAHPHGPRDHVRPQIEPEARADPQDPNQHDRQDGRQILRPDQTGQAPSGNRNHRHARGVVPDDDDGEGGEQKPLGQDGRGRGAGPGRPERVPDAADEPAGDEHRPALDVDGAHEGGQDDSGKHEPAGRRPENGGGEAGHEEGCDAELREGERGRLAHRHERQQRRRGQDDADAAAGADYSQGQGDGETARTDEV